LQALNLPYSDWKSVLLPIPPLPRQPPYSFTDHIILP
jgi:hypothetical protein